MSGDGPAVVEALLSAPIAWRSPSHLAAAAGLGAPAVFCALADLEAAGIFEHWETETELMVTLTPLGAARLGVRLIEVGPDELPRWARPGTPEPSPPKAKGIFRDYDALSLVPDPSQAAEEPLGEDELPAPGARRGRELLAQPRLLLGSSDVWGPWIEGPCPVCSDRLISGAYCLRCDGAAARPARRLDRKRRARRAARARDDRRARLRDRF